MKIKKILYLLFLFLMPFNITTAQQTYLSNLYNPYQTAGIGYHIIELDSFYLVGGLMYDSSLIKSSKEILKFDKSGNLISTINHSPKNISYLPGAPGSFNKAKDGTYIWGGTKRYDSFSKIYGFLMKLDSSLYLVWEKDFMFNNDTTYSYLRITQAKQTFDNGYILTGITEASGQYNFDIFLIKTDSLGNKIWQKNFTHVGRDWGWSVIQTPDSGFFIGGGGFSYYFNKSYDGVVIKTDNLGQEVWRRVFGGSLDDDKCMVANHPDGSLIVATSYCVYDPNMNSHDDYGFKKIHIIKLSQSNQIIWEKKYDGPKFWRRVNNLAVDTSGNIFVLSHHFSDDSASIECSSLIKLNSNGDSIWYRVYSKFASHTSENELYDLKLTSDNGIIMCGVADDYFSQYQPRHIWVLKVDSFGCDTPGCQTVGINELVINNHDLVIYPNPTNGEINIDFNNFEYGETINIFIYNSVGTEVKKSSVRVNNQTEKLNIYSLPKGIYYYQIIPKNSVGKLYSGKFIKM